MSFVRHEKKRLRYVKIPDQYKQEVKTLQQSAAADMQEQLRMSLSDEFSEKVQKLQADAVANLENALAQSRQDAIHAANEQKGSIGSRE